MFSQGQLRYFVTVSEEGQITRAAKRLHLAQPALSQAIAQLEGELGVELLVRHPRGVTLTDAGEAFLVKARAVLAAKAETAQTALALRRAASDAIAIGFVGPPPSLGCPELFGAFEARHPDAQISFLDLPFPRGHTADWLAGVDIAFCHAPMVEPRDLHAAGSSRAARTGGSPPSCARRLPELRSAMSWTRRSSAITRTCSRRGQRSTASTIIAAGRRHR